MRINSATIAGCTAALTTSLLLNGTLLGCGAPAGPEVSGTITAKEYEAAKYENKRTCTKKTNGKCTRYTWKQRMVEGEEWEVTITDAKGVAHEVEVDRDVYNRLEVGDQVTKGEWP